MKFLGIVAVEKQMSATKQQNQATKYVSLVKRPPFKTSHKGNQIKWATKDMIF